MRKLTGSYVIVLALLLFSCIGLYAQRDTLDFPAPQFMLPFYDHFALNHMSVAAMGRGQTTNAVLGRVDNAVNNPATLQSNKSFLYMELTIKPPISEINTPDSVLFSSPIPFGMFGVNGKIYKSLQGAISYNVPKSVVYDNYVIYIAQDRDFIQRYPAYYLHQITTTLAGSLGKLRLGLNFHQQFHQFKDITVYNTFDRLDKTFYVIRLQPGVYYKTGNLSMGATVTPPTSKTMDIKYAEYDVTLPMQVTGGVSYKYDNNAFYGDIDWEQFSKMSSAFDDRLTLKAGYEKRVRNTTYRCGIISMPGVYRGAFRLPVDLTAKEKLNAWWSDMPRGGYIGKTDQLYATAGFTYFFKGGELSLGLISDLLGNVSTTQFATSLGFNLDTFKGKKFLIFDK